MGVEVSVENLTKSFGKQSIWRDVTLTLPTGEVSALLGPSGTGKSVFLKSLIGLLRPERGSIYIDGTDITTCSNKELYEIRKLSQLLIDINAQIDATILIVTHNINLARSVPDNIGMLFRRQLV
ncbi:hypothetical protein C5E45_24625, partial [Nocardia nova]